MKKLFSAVALVTAMVLGNSVNAQSYKTGLGLMIDVGEGGTYVGPHIKHFFGKHGAGEFDVLFGSGSTAVQALVQYNDPIPGAKGLSWYIGGGPGLIFANKGGGNTFYLSPAVGLDFKITGVPLSFSADWRPKFFLSENGGSTIGRFGLGFKFTL